MSFVILIDDVVVETAMDAKAARAKAEEIQKYIHRYVDDEVSGAFAIVGFAPSGDLTNISYLKPSESVPDALVPPVFSQLRGSVTPDHEPSPEGSTRNPAKDHERIC